MIIVDKALKKRQEEGNPIRVAMIGAGFIGQGIIHEIINYVPGIKIVALSNRHISEAIEAYSKAGIDEVQHVQKLTDLNEIINRGGYAISEDAKLLCQAEEIDAIFEVTGNIEFGAMVALEAIKHKKHFITMSAELDATIGPILKVYADKAGVIYTGSDGDQPGVTINLFRFIKGIGIKPILCGNIKGLHDPYRNPTTQKAFAQKWGQKPHMVTSFADGSKISFEQASIANATGMKVYKKGMCGPKVLSGTPIEEAVDLFPLKEIIEGPGIVDYVVGATPAPGVFVLGLQNDPFHQHYLKLYKLGSGPIYCFYRPYHLVHFEAHNSIARAVLFHDATIAPVGKPQVEVITTAKINLEAGKHLDGIGHYMTYGQCENFTVSKEQNLLPLGIAEGCKLKKDIQKDQMLTYQDIMLPKERLIDKLRRQQYDYFFS